MDHTQFIQQMKRRLLFASSKHKSDVTSSQRVSSAEMVEGTAAWLRSRPGDVSRPACRRRDADAGMQMQGGLQPP